MKQKARLSRESRPEWERREVGGVRRECKLGELSSGEERADHQGQQHHYRTQLLAPASLGCGFPAALSSAGVGSGKRRKIFLQCIGGTERDD